MASGHPPGENEYTMRACSACLPPSPLIMAGLIFSISILLLPLLL